MLSGRVKVRNELGLHARAAAQLVKVASGFRSKITLTRPDLNIIADAKSILSLLTLSASKGTDIELDVHGEDETEAFSAIQTLFANGFGEK